MARTRISWFWRIDAVPGRLFQVIVIGGTAFSTLSGSSVVSQVTPEISNDGY